MRYLNWQECLAEKEFTQIIDVRSPGEFALDHIPGAVNLPVLNNDERAEVGRLYVQVSRYDARRLGAAMVARNAATHLEGFLSPYPEHSRFLLYCWRGGNRSKAMATILDAVGWDVTVLAGGYKNYRAHVREAMARLCPGLRCHILTGLTGSGKTDTRPRDAERFFTSAFRPGMRAWTTRRRGISAHHSRGSCPIRRSARASSP